MSRVGIIGDTHEPVSRPGYLNFVQDTFDAWDVDTIVHIGDLVDWHGISFWTKQPECPGPKDEYELAKERVNKWTKVFPKVKICIGNHDERPARLARSVNIPDFMLKPYSDLWGTPKWEWDFNYIIDGVLYKHGTGMGGIHPAWNLMTRNKMSVIIGHCHSRAGIKWSANPIQRFFAMDVGCGIDEKSWQFAYGRDIIERPILSCGIVIDGHPYLEIMPCGKGEKYHDSKFKKKK